MYYKYKYILSNVKVSNLTDSCKKKKKIARANIYFWIYRCLCRHNNFLNPKVDFFFISFMRCFVKHKFKNPNERL